MDLYRITWEMHDRRIGRDYTGHVDFVHGTRPNEAVTWVLEHFHERTSHYVVVTRVTVERIELIATYFPKESRWELAEAMP